MTEKTEGIKIEDAAADKPLEQEDADVSETTGDAEDIENTENTEEPAEESAEETEAPAEAAEPAEADDAKYLRLLAEFQNYKKRTEKEKTDLYSYANEKIMTELLEVLDNFERALEQEAGDGFKEGM